MNGFIRGFSRFNSLRTSSMIVFNVSLFSFFSNDDNTSKSMEINGQNNMEISDEIIMENNENINDDYELEYNFDIMNNKYGSPVFSELEWIYNNEFKRIKIDESVLSMNKYSQELFYNIYYSIYNYKSNVCQINNKTDGNGFELNETEQKMLNQLLHIRLSKQFNIVYSKINENEYDKMNEILTKVIHNAQTNVNRFRSYMSIFYHVNLNWNSTMDSDNIEDNLKQIILNGFNIDSRNISCNELHWNEFLKIFGYSLHYLHVRSHARLVICFHINDNILDKIDRIQWKEFLILFKLIVDTHSFKIYFIFNDKGYESFEDIYGNIMEGNENNSILNLKLKK